MNNIAVTPYIGMHALQLQNVKRNTVKKVSIDALNNEAPIVENDVSEVPVKKDEIVKSEISEIPEII